MTAADGPSFLDANVNVYALVDDPIPSVADQLLRQGGDLSVRVLDEFANAARKKLGFDWTELGQALSHIRTLSKHMQDGMEIDAKFRLENPFASSN